MLKAVLNDDIASFVQVAYAFDPTLLEKWHVTAGKGLNECVKRTVQDLENCKTLKFYCVYDEGNHFAGYFGVEFDGTYMPTIYLLPEYRVRRDEFWKVIEAHLQPVWRAGIYTKNIPCMKFYAKKGREIGRLQTPSGEAATFEFKRSGDSCR